MTAVPVVVWGSDDAEGMATAIVEALAAESGIDPRAVAEPPPWDGPVECVVTVPDSARTDRIAATHDVPVILFGGADAADVPRLLSDGAADFVPAVGEGSHDVLGARIRRAVRDVTGGEGELAGPPAPGEGGGPDEDAVGGDPDDDGAATPADSTLEQYARILEALEDGVYTLDAAGTCTYVNDGMVTLSGYSEAELLGADPRLLLDDRSAAEFDRLVAEALSEETGTVHVSTRTVIQRKTGEVVPCEAHLTVLRESDGHVRGTVGVLRDVAERERRQELLTRLQDTSRSLMQAPSRETVGRIVVDAARRTLGFDLAVVRLYDPDERVLEPIASTNATEVEMADRPTYDLGEGPAGEVFVSGEPAVYADVTTIDDDHDRSPVRAAMYFPIGVHGTLSIGTTTVDAFDDVDEQIATLLATNAAAACNRAKREREVRDARERIATILERINGLVENTIEVLVKATTRDEVERGVCSEIAATEPYVFAWVARPDVRGGELTAGEWVGSAGVDVDDVAIPLSGDAPGAVALREDDSQVIDAGTLAAAGADDGGWLADAHAAGIESAMAVPLSYHDGDYGVLYVCSERPDAFDEREQVVLEALGRAVANAINTVESGRILEADTVIELSVAVEDKDLLFSRLSASTVATLASAGTMTQEAGSLRLFLTAAGADAADVAAACSEDEAVESVSLVAVLEDEALFDVSVSDSIVSVLVDHGAVPKAIEAEGGVTRLTVELPNESAAREAFALVEDRYADAELVGYHERERPVRTQQEFRASLAERFTDRQETALRTAYLGGFFDWPRAVDGDELAQGMDISRPTYHQHLRAAQRKVFEELFETGGAAVE